MSEERIIMWAETIADVLNRLCLQNKRRRMVKAHVTRFRALHLPKITISEYVKRISLNFDCSEECFIIAMIYIERLTGRNKNFFINDFNVHRLILTSVMIATKYYDDQHFDNSYYCRVGGLSLKEINELERELLVMINFNTHVENELFTAWNRSLMSHNWWMSQQYARFQWEDEVLSAMASIVALPDMVIPIEYFPQVVHGYAAKIEEPSITQRSKPNGSSCRNQIWQYRNHNQASNLSDIFKANRSIQTR